MGCCVHLQVPHRWLVPSCLLFCLQWGTKVYHLLPLTHVLDSPLTRRSLPLAWDAPPSPSLPAEITWPRLQKPEDNRPVPGKGLQSKETSLGFWESRQTHALTGWFQSPVPWVTLAVRPYAVASPSNSALICEMGTVFSKEGWCKKWFSNTFGAWPIVGSIFYITSQGIFTYIIT